MVRSSCESLALLYSTCWWPRAISTEEQTPCIIPCLRVALSQAKPLSFSEHPHVRLLFLALPCSDSARSQPYDHPVTLGCFLLAGLWDHSCTRAGHRLVINNQMESKDRIHIFLERHQHGMMSVPFSTFHGDYGCYPFLLPEDDS